MCPWGYRFIEALAKHQQLQAIAEGITGLVTPQLGFPCSRVNFGDLALLRGRVKIALSSLAHVYYFATQLLQRVWSWEDDLSD